MSMRKYLYLLAGSLFLFGACGGGEDGPAGGEGLLVPGDVCFATEEMTEMENAGTVPVRINLSAPAVSDFTVTLDVASENNMVEGTDYLLREKEVRVSAGDSVVTVELELVDNQAADPGRHVELRLLDADGGQILTPSRCRINVVDDESQAAVVFVHREMDVREGDGTVRFPLKLRGAPAGTVHFKVEQTGGTAVEGVDYAWTAREADLSDTSEVAYVELALTDNEESDPLRTLVLEVTEVQGGFTLTSSSNTLVNLRDDDVALSFGAASYAVAETDKLLLIPLRLSQPLTEDLEVTLGVASASAVEGADFTLEKSLAIPAGRDSAMVALYVEDVEGYAPDKRLTLSVAACGDGGVSVDKARCEVAILDCDTRLSFGESPRIHSNASSVYVDVLLERPLEHDVTFRVTSDSYYFSGSETGYTIPAGSTTVEVALAVNGQIMREEACELYIADEYGATADGASVGVEVLMPIDKGAWSIDIDSPGVVTGGRASARNLIDGDANTVWTNNGYLGNDPVPYYADVDLGGPTEVSWLRLMRPDASVTAVKVYLSSSADYASAEWFSPISLGFGDYLYTEYRWATPQEVTFVRVEVTQVGSDGVGRLSELTLY